MTATMPLKLVKLCDNVTDRLKRDSHKSDSSILCCQAVRYPDRDKQRRSTTMRFHCSDTVDLQHQQQVCRNVRPKGQRTLSLTTPTSIGWAVSIVQSCKASHGSSGRPMLVAKSLAVPMGTTPMADALGALSLTNALATCTKA